MTTSTAVARAPRVPQRAAEWLGGMAGGVLLTVYSHPFDTVKVRLQAPGSPFTGLRATEVLRQTVQHEGIRGLYRGAALPVLLQGPLISFSFGLNGALKTALAPPGCTAAALVPLPTVALAAFLSVPFVCGLACPVEVARNRLQYQNPRVATLYRGPLDLFVKTCRTEGLAGLYRGFTATLLTRALAAPIYFGTYEAVMRLVYPDPSMPRAAAAASLVGAFAGGFHWLFFFPLDMIKTRIQTQRSRPVLSIAQTAREIHATLGGMRGFYRGLWPTLIRATPANGLCFLGLEGTLRALDAQAY